MKFTPKFTRIPSHVVLMADIEGLMHKFDVLRATMKDHMQEMIYERGVGGSEYHTNKVLKAIEE